MTNIKKKLPDPVFSFTLEQAPGEGLMSTDRASTCCGVLELGDFYQDGTVTQDEGGVDFSEYDMSGYSGCSCSECKMYYVQSRPDLRIKSKEVSQEKRAIYRAKLKAFKKLEEDAFKEFGLVTMYLLDSQLKGDIGKIVRSLRYEYLGKFWNPKTRNTLHHYRKVLRRSAPPKPRKRNSAFKGVNK